MKILKRAKKNTAKFKVIKANFCLPGGHMPTVGEELVYLGSNISDAWSLVRKGSLLPTDLPVIAKYICISSFYLPGREKKFEAVPGETIELKSADAIQMMMARKVIPKDGNQSSPYCIKEQRKIKDVFEDAQYSNGKTKVNENWIVRK